MTIEKNISVGLLDYAQIDEGKNAREALQETVTLARTAESLGYDRFWVAEHHNVPAFANSSPEVLMMHLANATDSIRIGSGGVMLPHYSSYKVAENFRLLESFHPERIDLGIGNTIGTPLVNRTLNENKRRTISYEQSVTDLTVYLTDTVNEEHRFHGISANPVIDTRPEMFILSTSLRSAKIAASHGIGYTFGLFPFLTNDKIKAGIEAVKVYREEFKPSSFMSKPKVLIAPFVAIADDKKQAENYAQALDLWLLGKSNFSEFERFPSVETAKNYSYSNEDLTTIQAHRSRLIVGDQESVKEQLNKLIDQFTANEVLLIPLIPGLKARKRAYHLLADLLI